MRATRANARSAPASAQSGPAADLVPAGVPEQLRAFLRERKRAWQPGSAQPAVDLTARSESLLGSPASAKSPEPTPTSNAVISPASPTSPAACKLASPVKRRRTLVFATSPPATPHLQQRSPAKLSKEYALTPLFHPEVKSPLAKTTSRDLPSSSSGSGAANAEVALLDVEQSEDGFQAWYDKRVQQTLDAGPSEPSLATARAEIEKLKGELADLAAERDAAVQENTMLRGENLGTITELELHDLGQFLDEAVTHLKAERRRRDFNRRMRQRSGNLVDSYDACS